MVAAKTNERPGTRAVARYVRVSASKAREVLNLVRGESYGRAAEILAFSERSVSDVVGKLLESAVANAENNDGIPAEELFVSTCYADEGPTLKRWRPRARGRATQILKRTCHITIIVTRYDEATLETMRELDAAKGRVGSNAQAADARRQRVERSRATAAEEATTHEVVDTPESSSTESPEAVESTPDGPANSEVQETPEVAEVAETPVLEEAISKEATAPEAVDKPESSSTESPEAVESTPEASPDSEVAEAPKAETEEPEAIVAEESSAAKTVEVSQEAEASSESDPEKTNT